MRQLRRWKKLWRRSLTRSQKRTSMGPCRRCWNSRTSALQPEEITSRGLEFHVWTINKSGHTKKVGKHIVCTSYFQEFRISEIFLISFWIEFWKIILKVHCLSFIISSFFSFFFFFVSFILSFFFSFLFRFFFSPFFFSSFFLVVLYFFFLYLSLLLPPLSLSLSLSLSIYLSIYLSFSFFFSFLHFLWFSKMNSFTKAHPKFL